MKYEKRKHELLNDKNICKENRELFKKFFEYEEYKLKRTNELRSLDAGTFLTLMGYISKFRNVNNWFNNKPLKKITKKDIQKVYDGLEDGKILNSNGKPFKDRQSYYNKVFRSKLFRMIGKDNLAREVMEFYRPNDNDEVRFIYEEDFRKLISVVIKAEHKLLMWLAFDIGENVNSLLRLRKKDCRSFLNEAIKSREYHINLQKEILKRSRKPRTEPTNYRETVELLDIVLKNKKDEDYVFNFKYRAGKKFLDRAVTISGVRCNPNGQRVTWKDLRSSMACDLLKKGWNTDEVNARLGHVPSSREIDKYVNFLALDRKKPQKKMFDHSLAQLKADLEDSKERENLYTKRISHLQEEMEAMQKQNKEKEKKDEFVFKFIKVLLQKGKIKDAADLVYDTKMQKELVRLSK